MNFDETMMKRLTKLEREVERLRVKESPIMSNYGRPVFLSTPLMSVAWDGDSFSTTSRTLIDMSTVFGVPAGVKAVLLKIRISDSSSASSTCQFQLAGTSTGATSFALIASEINNRFVYAHPVVPCDENGDLYYEVYASGTGTMSIFMQVWGYWL